MINFALPRNRFYVARISQKIKPHHVVCSTTTRDFSSTTQFVKKYYGFLNYHLHLMPKLYHLRRFYNSRSRALSIVQEKNQNILYKYQIIFNLLSFKKKIMKKKSNDILNFY